MKNPVYTARVGCLREMWPEARFIHIYRNPYTVHRSTPHYFEKMLSKLALQPYEVDAVEPVVLDSYPRMLNRLYRDTDDLPGWEAARPVTENYLARVADYSKNTYRYDAGVCMTVQSAWGRFVERWGYEMPDG